MIGRVLRVMIGFAAACLVAAAAMVLFVFTPAELFGLPPDVAKDRFPKLAKLAGLVAIQSALFSAPFALVVTVIGEWRRNRNWSFYALAGLLMALVGFLAQHSTEQAGQPTIVNSYALTAFLTAGLLGGLAYWLVSGRLAGGRKVVLPPRSVDPDIAPEPAKPAEPASKTQKSEVEPKEAGTMATADGKN